jgi:hypothetical protein
MLESRSTVQAGRCQAHGRVPVSGLAARICRLSATFEVEAVATVENEAAGLWF